MARRVYIHETIRITVKHRTDYINHMTDVWAPTSRKLHNLINYGVWATNGSTGVWPEAVVLWELESQERFGRMLSGEYEHLTDPSAMVGDHYDLYWGSAPKGVTDSDGFDRLVEPTDSTPSIREALARGLKGQGYYQMIVTCAPGAIDEVLAAYEAEWRPVAESKGLVFLGAFRTLMRNNSEAVILWALPAWTDWSKTGQVESDPAVRGFNERAQRLRVDWQGKLLVPAPRNPLNTGKLL